MNVTKKYARHKGLNVERKGRRPFLHSLFIARKLIDYLSARGTSSSRRSLGRELCPVDSNIVDESISVSSI